MFGDFAQNFGLPFPFQQADTQGGLFGLNAPTAPTETGSGSLSATGGTPQGGLPGAPTVPADPTANAIPGAVSLAAGQGSPLAAGSATPGQVFTNPAPAAGQGSPFGRPTP